MSKSNTEIHLASLSSEPRDRFRGPFRAPKRRETLKAQPKPADASPPNADPLFALIQALLKLLAEQQKQAKTTRKPIPPKGVKPVVRK